MAIDSPLLNLDDCGCCEGISAETPQNVYNRPGLTAIAYRVGTHAEFKETMLARLSGSRQPALQRLTTRENNDFSIALLDAWATVADVLTFYQERIANEAYLRTAVERLSVLEMARLIDYQLRPGVAATTYLAFTIEDTPGALSLGSTTQTTEPLPAITIDIGTKAQSIPGPGEQAQTFETVEKIEARAEWNAIKPRLTQLQPLSTSMNFAILQGVANNLKQGDKLLIVDNVGNRAIKTAQSVTTDDNAKTTQVDFIIPTATLPSYLRPTGLIQGSVDDFPTKVDLDENVIKQIISKTWKEEDLSALAETQNWSTTSLTTNIIKQVSTRTSLPNTGVFVFRQRAAIFGYNAPKWDSLPANLRFEQRIETYKTDNSGNVVFDKYKLVSPAFPTSWEDRRVENDASPIGNKRFIYLDTTYPNIVKDSWIALISPTGQSAILKVVDNVEVTRSDFAISGKISRLTVESSASLNDFKMRTTSVLVQSEQLTLADLPIIDLVPAVETISGNSQEETITLDRPYLGLKVGQKIIITGERSDLKGVVVSETAELKEVIIEAGFTVVKFKQFLAYNYVRKTVVINANITLATHGETVEEVLGNGDATQVFQRFTLRQPPLTYVSASTPSGAQTTLEMRVNDILWHEVLSFYDHGPEERIYITRIADDGKTTVIFGDGKTGARLPTGQENIKAKYRKGIGLGGLVKANQLSQLMSRPLGLKGVINPIAANGAADREKLDDARRNAPLTVLTLDRIVSLKDYEDFARAFSGIDKSLATWTWFGEKRGVFVTIAGTKGAEVATDSELYKNLLKAMQEAGDPTVPLIVKSYQPRLFQLMAAIGVHTDYLPETVLVEVEQMLRDSFSFEARTFGQPVHFSEVVSVIQNVSGVIAVDLKQLYRSDKPPVQNMHLQAFIPQLGEEDLLAAELLTLDPRPLVLEVLK
ncbi:MAG: putative baseplate assembly protein [Acidobacteriota bacterium]